MPRFTDQVVFITGATSGIGLETARVFRREGATVVGTGRRREGLAAVEALGARAVEMDVTDDASVARACDRVLGEHGRVDVVINNAGIGLFKPWTETPASEVERIMDTNLYGVVRVNGRMLPKMVERGRGVVVNVASVAGKRGYPKHTAYCASKHALIGYSESLRCDLEGTGVEVVVVCPPAVRTPFFENAGYMTFDEDHQGFVPMRPDAVAEGILDAVIRRRRQVILSPRAKMLYALSLVTPGIMPILRKFK